MIRFITLITLLCCVSALHCQELVVAEGTLKNVLTHLNSKNHPSFVYSLPSVANRYHSWKNSSTESSIAHLELRLKKCDEEYTCIEEHVICQLRTEENNTEILSCYEKGREPNFSGETRYNERTSAELEKNLQLSPGRLHNNESNHHFDDLSFTRKVQSHPEEQFMLEDFEIEKYLESLIETDDKPERNDDSKTKLTDSNKEHVGLTKDTVELNAVERRPVEEQPVVAKKAFCLGCPVDLNVNNSDLAQFIEQALRDIDEGSTNSYKHGLVKLQKARRQVVNGVIYMLLLDVGETNCVKESNIIRNLCSLNLKIEPNTCYIEIFEKPGIEKERSVVNNNCTETGDRYPVNEVSAAATDSSISNVENVPSDFAMEESFQPSSLDDMATASADEHIYNYAADYVEDSDLFPFLSLDIEGYLSDPAEYYYNTVKHNVRNKRAGHSGFIGNLKEIGPEEKHLVDELAAVAIETLDTIDEDNLKRVVIEVVDAKKQIMSGVMYYLKVIIGTTSCDENQPVISDCLQEFVQPHSVCVIQLHRSFIDNSPRVQVVKSECTPKEERKSMENFNSRNMKGSFSYDFDVEQITPQMMKVLQFTLSKINSKLKSVHTILEIVNIHTEVQDDIKIYITLKIAPCLDEENSDCVPNYPERKLCKAELIDHVPSMPMQLLNFSCINTEDTRKQEIHKLLGVFSPVEVNNPYIKDIAHTSILELDRRSNSLYRHKLIKILRAESQVVAGRLITLKMEIGYDLCQHDTENSAEDCTLRKDLGTKICDIKVWHRPWLKHHQINQISCVPVDQQRKKRSQQNRRLVGAPGQIDVEDAGVKNVLAFAVEELDKQTDSNFKRKAVKVWDAKVQVVAGVLYHLTIETSDTTCLKEAPQSAEECDVDSNSDNQICKVKVLVQEWRDHRELISSQCTEKPEAPLVSQSESRRKRAITPAVSNKMNLGGLKKTIKNPEAFMDIATFALHEIDRVSNSARRKKIVNILNLQLQIVEGIKYHLDLEVSDTKCLKRVQDPIENCELTEELEGQICHVEVWDRPWLNIRKVTKLLCGAKLGRNSVKDGEENDEKHNIHLGIFKHFMSKYNKTYKNEEEMQQRFSIFKNNLLRIEQLQNTEQGTGKYGITQFADLTVKEFKQKYLGLNLALRRENEIPMPQAKIPDIELPVEFDWRHYNVVTPVKNQGACGSCWAFSVTGNVEGQWAVHKGELLSLSEQELVDCDTLDSGCEGGLPDNAYRAIEKLGGLETETDYPYEGADEKCHFNKSEVRVRIQGAVNITSNETKMAQWLVKNGPISIGINANAMQFYVGGVSHPWKFLCDPNDLDHGVLIVGYGVHKYPLFKQTLPFWVIKNSWGERWGEQGYYRVYRGDGTCGVNMMASSAIVD